MVILSFGYYLLDCPPFILTFAPFFTSSRFKFRMDNDFDEVPRSELIVALAQVVAFIIALAAFIMFALLLILMRTGIIFLAEKVGLLPITLLVLFIFFGVSRFFGAPTRFILRMLRVSL